MSVLVLIPARGGSKGIKGKNLRTVGGVSLVGRAVLTGREFLRAVSIEGLVLVDTDSQEIADEATKWGASVPFLRDPALAADETSTADSTIATLDRLALAGQRFDHVVLLQPTSPLRTVEDVMLCWRAYEPPLSPSVVTVCRSAHPSSLKLEMQSDRRLTWLGLEKGGWTRRQDAPDEFQLTGAVYVVSTVALRAERSFMVPGITRGIEQPQERSIDIDTLVDLSIANTVATCRETSRMMIGAAQIGNGARCFIIAEAGVNHNGDSDRAHNLIDVAADAGADAVKFQTFDPDFLVSREAERAAYQVVNAGGTETQYEMLQRLTLPLEAYKELAEHAAHRGILFLSTAFDETTSDFLELLGIPAFKIPSGEITNHPFLAHLARKGKPLMLSTGMSTLVEVVHAVDVIRQNGNPPLSLFHCVTDYPAAPSDCNLGAIETLRQTFSVPVGWSDHTEGFSISLAAVSAGAELLEKHFTMDRTLPGPDHAASLEPLELIALVQAIREIEAAQGDGVKRPTPAEMINIPVVRRSLHVRRDLPPGHSLAADDLIALRPGTGISPAQRDGLLGRTLRVAVPSGSMLRESDLV